MFIDTNVMVEIYSQADLYAAATRGNKVVEERRWLLQGALWFAVALSERRAVTVCLHDEARDTLLRLSPPKSDVAVWTARMLYILRESLFPGWKALASRADAQLPKGRAGNNARDRLIVDLCRKHRLVLVTRDDNGKRGQPGITTLARRARVSVMTPEEYAEKALPRESARQLADKRMFAGAKSYVDAAHGDEHAERIMTMLETIDRHDRIWKPAGFVTKGGEI